MLNKLFALLRLARPVAAALERLAGPAVDLFIRVLLFRVFFYAGTAKLGNWSGTLELFEYEYQVPILPPMLAAYMGTASELICSVLILIGLASRLATLPLIGITLTIQFVLGAANPVYDQLDHFLWLGLLAAVLARGPGVLSLDALLVRKCFVVSNSKQPV
jgi:putative oxidoreductase